jgi:hypothetical protein
MTHKPLKLLAVALVFLGFIGCNTKRNDHSTEGVFNKAEVQELTFGACDTLNGGTGVSFTLLMPTDSGKAAEQIRQFLKNSRVASVTSTMDSVYVHSLGALSEQVAYSAFDKIYREFKIDFPDAPGCWEIVQKGDTIMTTPKIVAYELDLYTFTGGAHPNSNKQYTLFDRQTGVVVPFHSFVKDSVMLLRKTEEAFRKLESLQPIDDLEEKGYFLNNNQFFRADNCTFTREGVQVYYNPYEIAPYVRGPIEFIIPYQELKGVIRDERIF